MDRHLHAFAPDSDADLIGELGNNGFLQLIPGVRGILRFLNLIPVL